MLPISVVCGKDFYISDMKGNRITIAYSVNQVSFKKER